MNGHKLHLGGSVGSITVRKQRDVRQIVFKRCLLAAGGLIFVNGLLQLSQIVQPLLTALGSEHLLITAVVEDG